MQEIEISTYWNATTLANILGAVATVMRNHEFKGLLKLAFLLALSIWIIGFAIHRQLGIARWFFQAFIFTTLLNLPVMKVTIVDRNKIEAPRTVDHVPYLLAIVARFNSLAFSWITERYETTFGLRGELMTVQSGVGFVHRLLRAIKQTKIGNAYLHADLVQFFKECTIYDFRDGTVGQNNFSSKNPWEWVLDPDLTNPARFVTYNVLTPKPQVLTCPEAALALMPRLNQESEQLKPSIARMLFSYSNAQLASSRFEKAVPAIYASILGSEQNASDSLKQALFSNMWKDAAQEIPNMLNEPAGQNEWIAGFRALPNIAAGVTSETTLSLLAQDALPQLRNWTEAVIYAFFPIVVILAVCAAPDGARKLLLGYGMTLIWIGLWPVLFAVINHLSILHLKTKALSLGLLGQGVPMPIADSFENTLVNEQNFIGYMLVTVPFISWILVRIGEMGFVGMTHHLTIATGGTEQVRGVRRAFTTDQSYSLHEQKNLTAIRMEQDKSRLYWPASRMPHGRDRGPLAENAQARTFQAATYEKWGSDATPEIYWQSESARKVSGYHPLQKPNFLDKPLENKSLPVTFWK